MDQFDHNVKKLREYKKLHEEGIINDGDYNNLKENSLNSLTEIETKLENSGSKYKSLTVNEFNKSAMENMSFTTFKGRFKRSFFLLGYISSGILVTFGYLIFFTTPNIYSNPNSLFTISAGLSVVIIGSYLAIISEVKRLQDCNESGWWVLVNFIPMASVALLAYLLFAKGTDGDNKYGTDPRVNYKNRL